MKTEGKADALRFKPGDVLNSERDLRLAWSEKQDRWFMSNFEHFFTITSMSESGYTSKDDLDKGVV